MIASPGARSEVSAEMFENPDSSPCFVVEPTLTVVETQAGKLMAPVALSFPAETTVGMPAERRLSMIVLIGSPSQGAVESPPLRFRLAAAKLWVSRPEVAALRSLSPRSAPMPCGEVDPEDESDHQNNERNHPTSNGP